MRVAVVGATGLIGSEIVSLLAERGFPVDELLLYASEASEGGEIEFREESLKVRRVPEELPAVALAFLSATADVSREIAGGLAAKGALVLDLAPGSSAEMLALGSGPVEALRSLPATGRVLAMADPLARLVATPLRALAPIGKPKRAVTTLLVSASAFGRERVEELGRQTVSLLNGQSSEENDALAFSCIPENVSTARSIAERVEVQVPKLLAAEFPLVVSVVRTPTFVAHAASIAVEIAAEFSSDQAWKALREAPSLVVAEPGESPIGTRDVAGGDAVHVVGLRQDPSDPRWLQFWALADNIRQGAALAAVSVAEALLSPRGQTPGKAPGGPRGQTPGNTSGG